MVVVDVVFIIVVVFVVVFVIVALPWLWLLLYYGCYCCFDHYCMTIVGGTI